MLEKAALGGRAAASEGVGARSPGLTPGPSGAGGEAVGTSDDGEGEEDGGVAVGAGVAAGGGVVAGAGVAAGGGGVTVVVGEGAGA